MDGPRDDEDHEEPDEFSRPPTFQDLLLICRALNERGARYVVIGGMAMNYHGMLRGTSDIDLLVDADEDNMARVLDALSLLPDHAARELRPAEIQQYSVLRINDEVTVDLLARACGVTYADATIDVDESAGVRIPYGTPDTLIRTKNTYREKDRLDCLFLRELSS